MIEQVFYLQPSVSCMMLKSVCKIAMEDESLLDKLVMILRKGAIQKDVQIRKISLNGTMALVYECAYREQFVQVYELLSNP